jgi:hypothetical protein
MNMERMNYIPKDETLLDSPDLPDKLLDLFGQICKRGWYPEEIRLSDSKKHFVIVYKQGPTKKALEFLREHGSIS